MAKITRAEAVALINKHFDKGVGYSTKPRADGYGRVELRCLLDAIYGTPSTDEERLMGGSDR